MVCKKYIYDLKHESKVESLQVVVSSVTSAPWPGAPARHRPRRATAAGSVPAAAATSGCWRCGKAPAPDHAICHQGKITFGGFLKLGIPNYINYVGFNTQWELELLLGIPGS